MKEVPGAGFPTWTPAECGAEGLLAGKGDTERPPLLTAFKAADGKGYAVNLKDSRLLKDNGIYCDDLYILIRRNYKDDEKNTQAHDDSIAVAEALVK